MSKTVVTQIKFKTLKLETYQNGYHEPVMKNTELKNKIAIKQ